MDFWFGFVCGVLALIAVAVALHVWAERKRRQAFQRMVDQAAAAMEAKFVHGDSQIPGTPVGITSKDADSDEVDEDKLFGTNIRRAIRDIRGPRKDVH